MRDWGDRGRGRGLNSAGTGGGSRDADKQRTPEEKATERVYRLWQEVESASTRVQRLSAIVRRDEWRTEREKLQQTRDTLVENLKARELDAKVSARAREHYANATKKLDDVTTTLTNAQEPSRPVPPVAGEEAIEGPSVDRSAAADDVLAWVAGLGTSERRAIAERVRGVQRSVDRTDGFAVALANYLAGTRMVTQFFGVAENPRRFQPAAHAKAHGGANAGLRMAGAVSATPATGAVVSGRGVQNAATSPVPISSSLHTAGGPNAAAPSSSSVPSVGSSALVTSQSGEQPGAEAAVHLDLAPASVASAAPASHVQLAPSSPASTNNADGLSAAMSMEPKARRAGQEARRSAVADPSKPVSERKRLEDERATLEFAAHEHGESALPMPDPGPHAVDFGAAQWGASGAPADQSWVVSTDPVFLRAMVEREYAKGGEIAVLDLIGHMQNKANLARSHQANPAEGEQLWPLGWDIASAMGQQYELLEQENALFLADYERTAHHVVDFTLTQSEQRTLAEIAKYGITRDEVTDIVETSDRGWKRQKRTVYGGGNTAGGQELATAAAEIVASQREIDKMRSRVAKAQLDLFSAESPVVLSPGHVRHPEQVGPLKTLLAALERKSAAAEQVHLAAAQKREEKFPILASYRRVEDHKVTFDVSKLEKLGGADSRRDEIAPHLFDILDNVKKTREGLKSGGELSIWKEDRVRQLTMPQMLIVPGSVRERAVLEKTAQEKRGGWGDWAIAALTAGLALLAAIPTGGSSLAVGIVAIVDGKKTLVDGNVRKAGELLTASWHPDEVVRHMRSRPGLGTYLEMLEREGVATKDDLNKQIVGLWRKFGEIEDAKLGHQVKQVYRRQVLTRLTDNSLDNAASYQRMRAMLDPSRELRAWQPRRALVSSAVCQQVRAPRSGYRAPHRQRRDGPESPVHRSVRR